MTKLALRKELKEKIREGVKPSDLRKKRTVSIPTPPDSPTLIPVKENQRQKQEQRDNSPPPISIEKVKQLQQDLNFWKTTTNSHLTNLQLAQGKIINLEEENRKLKQKPIQLTQTQELALTEANQKIREQGKTIEELREKIQSQEKTIQDLQSQIKNSTNTKPEKIKTFLCSDCQQAKPQTELSRQFSNFSFCRTCSQKARAKVQQEKLPSFTCVACEKEKTEIPHYKKVDISYKTHLIKGQEYPVCSSCLPYIKEYNEHEDQEFFVGED